MTPPSDLDAIAEMKWLPIETCPRDGTNVLLAIPSEQLHYKAGSLSVVIGLYAPRFSVPPGEDVEPEKYPNIYEYSDKHGEYFSKPDFFRISENYYGDESYCSVTPEYWMPLPAPPARTGKAGGG